jgi:VanZ family protein
MVKKTVTLIFLIIWFGVVLMLSLSNPESIPKFVLFPHADKVVHVIMYLILTFLCLLNFFKPNYFFFYIVSAFVLNSIIGVILELMQIRFIPGRTGDILDVVSNITGSLTGIVLFLVYYRFFNTKNG